MFGAFSTGAMAGADWEVHNRQGDGVLEWENEQIGTFPGPWLVGDLVCWLKNAEWCCIQSCARPGWRSSTPSLIHVI